MLNISFISLLSFVLVYLNIIILNEEILILFCFITFCWIIVTKLGSEVTKNLKNQSLVIENSLKMSLNNLLKALIRKNKLSNNYKMVAFNFKTLNNHYIQLGTIISSKLPAYKTQESQKTYYKKILFTHNLEKQTVKLLTLILSDKLAKVSLSQNFCAYELKETRFKCFAKIILREYIETI
uniref:ATP synthase F0 subunit b n=1 Tax=Caulacanthus ustulatus TaxID=31411 RepID=UPI003001F97E|nr:ATP synthase F0 subunit b [Caulacanthus ustulatus]